MHNKAMEMAKWAMEKACSQGYDKITSQGWDDFKDCMEAAEKAIKADYYYKVIEYMNEEDEEYKRFYPRQRDSRGRFVSRRRGYEPIYHMPIPIWDDEQYLRDMDIDDGRMYYSNNMRKGTMVNPNFGISSGRSVSNMNPSRYGYSHDEYLSERSKHSPEEPEGKRKRAELLNKEIEEICNMAKEVVDDLTPEEKQMWKSKISKIMNL